MVGNRLPINMLMLWLITDKCIHFSLYQITIFLIIPLIINDYQWHKIDCFKWNWALKLFKVLKNMDDYLDAFETWQIT